MFHLSSGIKDALSRVGSKEHFNIRKFIGYFHIALVQRTKERRELACFPVSCQ